MFTRQVKYKVGKSTLIIRNIKEICQLGREIDIFPSIKYFTDRAFSNFRLKKNQSDQSEYDIKVLFPAPTQ